MSVNVFGVVRNPTGTLNWRARWHTSPWTRLHHFVRTMFEVKSSGERLTPMEGLRGFAVLLVFFVHFNSLFDGYFRPESFLNSLFNVLGHLGHLGVELFFLLSGFLISGIVFNRRTTYAKYLRRRAERLYPTFLAVTALYLVLSIALPAVSKVPHSPGAASLYLIANLLMLPGMTSISPLIMVAWSLSYEWFFYLTIPLVLAGLGLRRWTSIQRISLVLFLSAVFLFLVAAGFATHVRLLGFVPGILLWEVVTYRSMVPKLKAWGEYVAIATFLIDVVWFGLATTEHDPTGVVASSVPYSFWLSFYVAAFFLVSYALFFDGILKRIFSWDWLRWLGNISYSYYLIHVLSLHGLAFLLRLLSPPKPIPSVFGIILLLAAFAATLCCGACLFLLVEKPLSLTKAPKPRGPSCVAATELQKSA